MTRAAIVMLASLCALLVPLGYWIGGFDFDERGSKAVLVYLHTVIAAVTAAILAWLFPRA